MIKPRLKVQQQRKIARTTDDEMMIYKDALDIENHQHLPVLFCSFFYNQKGASSFCAPPTLLDMKFYGQHDIMLGQFLHRYCFRLWTDCSRCRLPMLGHIRRYVHSMGCVKVFLNEDNTNIESNQIYFTAWCSLCNEITPTVPLSESSKCLSLAKYLELRFHGHAYKKRCGHTSSITSQVAQKCAHSLHRDYIHQFSYRGVAAKFQYTPIETWEIILPTLVNDLHPPHTYNRYEVLEEVKNFSMRGHDIYTRIHERIADLVTADDSSCLSLVVNSLKNALNKDHLLFKQHIEIIQTILTEEKATYYDINDALLMTKRILAESIERWEPRLHECAQKLNTKQQNHDTTTNLSLQQQIDAGMICNEEILNADTCDLSAITPPPPVEEQQISSVEVHTANEKSMNNNNNLEGQYLSLAMVPPPATSSGDKKTIKKMLNQLLPSSNPVVYLQSPFPQTEHYTLPLGSFPIIINDQDLSSIIAYSLTCKDYKNALGSLTSSSGADHGSLSTQTNSSVGALNAGGGSGLGAGSASPHGKRKSQEW